MIMKYLYSLRNRDLSNPALFTTTIYQFAAHGNRPHPGTSGGLSRENRKGKTGFKWKQYNNE